MLWAFIKNVHVLLHSYLTEPWSKAKTGTSYSKHSWKYLLSDLCSVFLSPQTVLSLLSLTIVFYHHGREVLHYIIYPISPASSVWEWPCYGFIGRMKSEHYRCWTEVYIGQYYHVYKIALANPTAAYTVIKAMRAHKSHCHFFLTWQLYQKCFYIFICWRLFQENAKKCLIFLPLLVSSLKPLYWTRTENYHFVIKGTEIC